MESEDVIRGRRSIRAYTTEPVADDLVRDILDQARWAPSSQNTQPWRVWVLSGDALERFKAAGKPVVAWGGDFNQRRYFLAAHASEVLLHPIPPPGTPPLD